MGNKNLNPGQRIANWRETLGRITRKQQSQVFFRKNKSAKPVKNWQTGETTQKINDQLLIPKKHVSTDLVIGETFTYKPGRLTTFLLLNLLFATVTASRVISSKPTEINAAGSKKVKPAKPIQQLDVSLQARTRKTSEFFTPQTCENPRSSFLTSNNAISIPVTRAHLTSTFELIVQDLINGKPSLALHKIPVIDDISMLYRKIKFINEGTSNDIFHVTDIDANEFALRVCSYYVGMSSIQPNLDAYATLSKMRKFSAYIPQQFSVYYTKALNFKEYSNNFAQVPDNADGLVFCTEMEFIPQDYESVFKGSNKQLMEPRTIFEEVLGNYLVDAVAHCNINDPDGDVLRHHLFVNDPNPVCYRIDDEYYLFPPGLSPRKIDYDFFSAPYFTEEHYPFRISEYSFLHEHASEKMKLFLDDINLENSIFNGIKNYFNEFRGSAEKLAAMIKSFPNTKCFDLTELMKNRFIKTSLPNSHFNL